MRSIKPGRGPSFLGGVGSIAAAIFGIIWTLAAASMGAPGFFPLFGLVFVALGVVQAVYHFKNATNQNRYSMFDITDGQEEPDPLNQRYGKPADNPEKQSAPANFCPYCGEKAASGHMYCKNCGKKLS